MKCHEMASALRDQNHHVHICIRKFLVNICRNLKRQTTTKDLQDLIDTTELDCFVWIMHHTSPP